MKRQLNEQTQTAPARQQEPIAVSPQFEWFWSTIRRFQEDVVDRLESLDGHEFQLDHWTREEGGGGTMASLRGDRIEKGAVLCSRVHGERNPLSGGAFVAGGCSVILHPRSPHAPAVHLNVRRFEEPQDAWWGAGIDITPMGVRHEDDVQGFHEALQESIGDDYEVGRTAADMYFFVPHRNRPRGAGGVFFDRLHRDDDGADLEIVKGVLSSFFTAYMPILERRCDMPFTRQERDAQAQDRAVYVEFNLLYDRGTRFGFQSGGNPQAILSSMPPSATW